MDMHRVHLLLVEDNVDHAELAKAALEADEGTFEVDVVSSGDACLERLKGGDYDMVLVDYSLPGMHGLEVLQAIRDKGYEVPVAIVTGRGDEHVAVEAMKAGAYDYITKEGNYWITLPLAVRRVLEKHHMVQEQRRLEQELVKAERRAAIAEIAIAVNHEINNPLSVILGNAELLLAEIDEGSAEARRKLNIIAQQCMKIRGITQKLATLKDPVFTEYLQGIKMVDIEGSK